jgi:hypothetical protein
MANEIRESSFKVDRRLEVDRDAPLRYSCSPHRTSPMADTRTESDLQTFLNLEHCGQPSNLRIAASQADRFTLADYLPYLSRTL